MCHLVGEASLALLSLHPSPMVRMLRDTEPGGHEMMSNGTRKAVARTLLASDRSDISRVSGVWDGSATFGAARPERPGRVGPDSGFRHRRLFRGRVVQPDLCRPLGRPKRAQTRLPYRPL